MNTEPLADTERELLATALLEFANRRGPSMQGPIVGLAKKLGVLDLVRESTKDWLSWEKTWKANPA